MTAYRATIAVACASVAERQVITSVLVRDVSYRPSRFTANRLDGYESKTIPRSW